MLWVILVKFDIHYKKRVEGEKNAKAAIFKKKIIFVEN